MAGMTDLTVFLATGQEMPPALVAEAAHALLDESVGASEKAAFLRALSDKGETPAEIAAFVDAFLERAVVPAIDRDAIERPMIDVCGTGGDRLDLFNVSTASVFVLAGAGAAVIKHGNRAIRSRCGGADVLEALGIRIDLPPESIGDCLAACGAAFLFAPLYHPAFKAVAPVRQRLAAEGRRTLFNLLGPLLNPARPEFQLLGVFDAAMAETFAGILHRLGHARAWAVHGVTDTGAGMDELSSIGPNQVWETQRGEKSPRGFAIDPADLGIASGRVEDLRGGGAVENAAIIQGILNGEITGPKRDIVALNAAAGIVISGVRPDLRSASVLANEALDNGAAAGVLETWRGFRR